MNLHTPERGSNETMQQYRARQAKSREAVLAMRRGPTQEPVKLETSADGTAQMVNTGSSFWLGEHRNRLLNSKRKLKKMFGARQLRAMTKRARRSEAPVQ